MMPGLKKCQSRVTVRIIQNVPRLDDETPACPDHAGTHECQITLHRDL